MPKIASNAFPVSGLFAIAKPSGPTSMSLLNDMQPLIATSKLFVSEDKIAELKKNKRPSSKKLRQAVKIGQGGTLDPLADGVLVVGVGKGTKKLNEFLLCSKEYRTTGLLGCETDTYDSEGAQVRQAHWRHVTREMVEAAIPPFVGEIKQTPPIFSALKMDGKPLYEYARGGIPLPRPIEARPVTVHSLEVVEWLGSDHSFRPPEKRLSDAEREKLEAALRSVQPDAKVKDEPEPATATEAPAAETTKPAPTEGAEQQGEGITQEAATVTSAGNPTAFSLKMTVSSGTYVRTIVHDLAHAVGSAGHVVVLTRTRQGKFTLADDSASDPSKATHEDAAETSTTADAANPSADAEAPSASMVADAAGPSTVEGAAKSAAPAAAEADPTLAPAPTMTAIPWAVFERAIKKEDGEPDAEGWREWEREVMARMEVV
ncbi:pseudouridine synthase [Schizophyllum amplum]|uniref:tRNA pseudouridine(55) synthase n=1 Tax=Schizophyllum amplum TaxID=97359 RepID=A0A550BUM6_9AGAR|nr:pseudouridine synthase [Auriculariopsis ampla]